MSAPHPGKWRPVFVKPEPEHQPSIVLDTEQISAHSAVICTDLQNQKWKVLYGYPAYREDPLGDNKVRTRIWDPDPTVQNPISFQNIPDWPIPNSLRPTLFCGGHTFLSDGRILWAGGMRLLDEQTDVPHVPSIDIWGNKYTYIFDPDPQTPGQEWKVAGEETREPHSMSDDRYYPTLIHLGIVPQGSISGKIIAMSGWLDYQGVTNYTLNREPEYYDETNGWSHFPHSGATQPFNGPYDYYPSAHLIPCGPNAGKLFFSLPMKQSYVFNPFFDGFPNGGYWQGVGTARSNYRLNGTSTLLPILPPYTSAKVILIGGSTSETSYDSLAIRSADVIDIASGSPQWTHLNNFSFFARKNHITVILPDDMLFVVGGNLGSLDEGQGFGANPEYSTELIDARDSQVSNWKSIMHPAHVYPREHHLTSLLLPDGTVFVGGSGELGEHVHTVKHFEIYEPGYLFEGARPDILSPLTQISYGSAFNIETSHQISTIRLIRLGIATHSTDMSQLSVGLSLQAGPSNGSYLYTVTPPPNANIAPPGLYMLFVLRNKSQSISGETMIPSVAKIVKLS